MEPDVEDRTKDVGVTVAVAQVSSARSPQANLTVATARVAEAKSSGARVVVFPEYFMSWGSGRHGLSEMAAVAESLDSQFVEGLCQLARDEAVWLASGVVESGDHTKPFNTSILINSDGDIVISYRKTHLFDAFDHHESATFAAGNELSHPVATPFGVAGVFVCYELRFPEVARRLALAGAQVLVVPSAWVAGPGKSMQWESLLRARAIENGCYVIAAGQSGNEFSGGSIVVDPTGEVLAHAGTDERLIVATIDVDRVRAVRRRINFPGGRRPDLY
jgi:predicted amidohydrolase